MGTQPFPHRDRRYYVTTQNCRRNFDFLRHQNSSLQRKVFLNLFSLQRFCKDKLKNHFRPNISLIIYLFLNKNDAVTVFGAKHTPLVRVWLCCCPTAPESGNQPVHPPTPTPTQTPPFTPTCTQTSDCPFQPEWLRAHLTVVLH